MYNNLSITHFESWFRDQTKGFLVCIINICNVVYYSKQFWEQFWVISTHLCQEHSLPHDFLFMKGFKVVVYVLCNKHTKILMCTTFKNPIRVVFGSCDCLYKFWKVSSNFQTSGKLRRSVALYVKFMFTTLKLQRILYLMKIHCLHLLFWLTVQIPDNGCLTIIGE